MPPPEPAPADPLRGLEGWLLLFIVLMAGTALFHLVYLVLGRIEIAQWTALHGPLPLRLQLANWFLGLAKVVIPLAIVRRLIRDRRWRSVQLAVAGVWLLWLGLPLIDIGHVLVVGDPLPPGMWRQVTVDLIRNCMFALGATWYLLASRRVEATYPRLAPGAEEAARDTFS